MKFFFASEIVIHTIHNKLSQLLKLSRFLFQFFAMSAVGNRHRYSDDLKERAVARWKEGFSYGDLSELLDVPRPTIQKWIENFRSRGKVTISAQLLEYSYHSKSFLLGRNSFKSGTSPNNVEGDGSSYSKGAKEGPVYDPKVNFNLKMYIL